MNNKNLGEVEWNFEWLYTFPASARALFTSKLFVYSFLNPVVWGFFYPFLILVYVAAGYGFLGIFVGLAALLYLMLLSGALCTFLEVALRKLFNLSQLKNTQALFTVLGTVSLLLVYAACTARHLDDFLVERATAMPEFLAWNPFSLPLVGSWPAFRHRIADATRRNPDDRARFLFLLAGSAGKRVADAGWPGQSRRALSRHQENLQGPPSQHLAARRCRP
jgi:hypothetical protein